MESIKETTLETVIDITPVKLNDNEIVPISLQTEKVEVNPENVLIDGVEYLYNHLKSIHSEKITPSNIVYVATELIQLVEKYKELTGHQKKTMVLSVVKKLVNSQFDTEDDKKTMNMIIDLTLPTVVDNLINAINGNLKFDKEKIKSFFKRFFCCT